MATPKEPCVGIKGGNLCGRNAEFVIDIAVDTEFGDAYNSSVFSCVDCVGRIMIEQDLDSATVERIYQ
jgi:hypothetical protein